MADWLIKKRKVDVIPTPWFVSPGNYIGVRPHYLMVKPATNTFRTNIITNTKNIHITPSIRNVRMKAAFFKEPYFLYKIYVPIPKESSQSIAAIIT